jgi:hypothetical protein
MPACSRRNDMTPENFVYWLQGFHGTGQTPADARCPSTDMIRDHLDLVMEKQTPNRTAVTDTTGSRTELDTQPDCLFSALRLIRVTSAFARVNKTSQNCVKLHIDRKTLRTKLIITSPTRGRMEEGIENFKAWASQEWLACACRETLRMSGRVGSKVHLRSVDQWLAQGASATGHTSS